MEAIKTWEGINFGVKTVDISTSDISTSDISTADICKEARTRLNQVRVDIYRRDKTKLFMGWDYRMKQETKLGIRDWNDERFSLLKEYLLWSEDFYIAYAGPPLGHAPDGSPKDPSICLGMLLISSCRDCHTVMRNYVESDGKPGGISQSSGEDVEYVDEIDRIMQVSIRFMSKKIFSESVRGIKYPVGKCHHDNIELDLTARKLIVNNTQIYLSKNETIVFHALIRKRKKSFYQASGIGLQSAKRFGLQGGDNSLYGVISRQIKPKLRAFGIRDNLVVNVRGQGYFLNSCPMTAWLKVSDV